VQAKFFVGGNWKCNGTHASVEQLVMGLNAGRVPSDIDVVVAPPFIFLDWVRANINGQYDVAAQNCWVKSDGAFTGEISAEMLKDAQVPWVITGHSERRSLCGESNTFVGQKTGHALEVGLKVGGGLGARAAAATQLRCPARHALLASRTGSYTAAAAMRMHTHHAANSHRLSWQPICELLPMQRRCC
jgi:triosephosphate isomerase